MPTISAGLLLYRRRGGLEVLLVHPGGPLWAKKDAGAWSIPKGEVDPGEDLLAAAQREFQEETGLPPPAGPFIPLPPARLKSGKLVHAFAAEGDCDPAAIRSNTFTMPWPPRTGRLTEFPEIDRAEWFPLPAARQKLNPAQVAFLDELAEALGER